MLLDANPTAVLRAQLSAKLKSRTPAAELEDAPAERLAMYAYEDLLGGAQPAAAGVAAVGWVAKASDQHALRCFLVAQFPPAWDEDWFAGLLGTAARWRSHLVPDEQSDLSMLLVDAGSATPPGRVDLLERNEAFAQVHVWAPGADPARWPEEAGKFISRLRLGPVDGLETSGATDLSPLEGVFKGVPTGIGARWRSVLLDQGLKPGERARQLVATFDEFGGGVDGR